MQLSIETVKLGSTKQLFVSGEVDVSCADELRAAVDEALDEETKTVEVDLSSVSYIDSTGIGVLVGAAHKAADAGAVFSLCNPQRNVARVLMLLGVYDELNVRTKDLDSED